MKQDFHSLYAHEFVRLAAAVPRAHVGDPRANAEAILSLAEQADAASAAWPHGRCQPAYRERRDAPPERDLLRRRLVPGKGKATPMQATVEEL